jgi:hypothetical protein
MNLANDVKSIRKDINSTIDLAFAEGHEPEAIARLYKASCNLEIAHAIMKNKKQLHPNKEPNK